MGVIRRVCEDEPRPIREINPDVPDWFCSIVDRLLSKKREDRFQSAEEVASLLADCLAHVQQPQTQPLPDSLHVRRRISLWTGLLTVFAGAAVAVLFYAAWMLPGDRDTDSGGADEAVAQAESDTHHLGETKAEPASDLGVTVEPAPEGFSPWGELDGELNSITSDLNALNWELEVDLELSDESGAAEGGELPEAGQSVPDEAEASSQSSPAKLDE